MKRSEIYKAIRDAATAGMPWLAYTDLQKQQAKRKAGKPFPMPAMLVELKGGRYSNVAHLHQMGEMTVSLYLYLDLVSDSYEGAETEAETLDILDKADELWQVMQGVSGEQFTGLVRTSDGNPEYGTDYICLRTDFTTEVKDEKVVEMVRIARPPVRITLTDRGE